MGLTSTSILIVDDEQELSTLYREYLLEMGFDAVSFTNPLMAFEHYRHYADKYSLIITDLRMPGMSGIELANKIRKFDSSIKIFLITAFDIADIEGQESYKSAKIDATLQKPIKLSLLRKIIGQHIEVTVYSTT
jgi:CheY-like chemotaxis protein